MDTNEREFSEEYLSELRKWAVELAMREMLISEGEEHVLIDVANAAVLYVLYGKQDAIEKTE